MRFLPLMFLFVFVAVFLTFFPNIFGGFETQHNMTASNYTTEYDALTELTQTDMIIIGGVGTLLVIGMLFILWNIFT